MFNGIILFRIWSTRKVWCGISWPVPMATRFIPLIIGGRFDNGKGVWNNRSRFDVAGNIFATIKSFRSLYWNLSMRFE